MVLDKGIPKAPPKGIRRQGEAKEEPSHRDAVIDVVLVGRVLNVLRNAELDLFDGTDEADIHWRGSAGVVFIESQVELL